MITTGNIPATAGQKGKKMKYANKSGKKTASGMKKGCTPQKSRRRPK